jgi:hypothetical protein
MIEVSEEVVVPKYSLEVKQESGIGVGEERSMKDTSLPSTLI